MDVSSIEKMAMASRQMMTDFLKTHFEKTIAKETDSELVRNAKSRFLSILKHIYEVEYLYFYNPLTGSNEKPDIPSLTQVDAEKMIATLAEPREKLYKLLSSNAKNPNELITGSEMTPNLVYFRLARHDFWHLGQMQILVEMIEKESVHPNWV